MTTIAEGGIADSAAARLQQVQVMLISLLADYGRAGSAGLSRDRICDTTRDALIVTSATPITR